MKRTIEMDDTLQERVDGAIEEVRAELVKYIEENKSDSCPDMGDLDYSGTIHEIIDGSVPIYNKEISDTWYLYQNELEEAFEDAGIYSPNEKPENYEQVCIYCYIEQQVNEWYHDNAEEIFEEERAKLDAAEESD